MKNNYNYLKDKNFLKTLIKQHIVTYFVKITFLDWEEKPIKEIEKKVISANFNMNGRSIIRRTGNINLIFQEEDLIDLFSLNRKIDIEIGYKNTTDQYLNYDILWFPLGVYVITNASFSQSSGGITAALELKDKMCLLNGECGGTLSASVVFDNMETLDESGKVIITRPTIYQIIRELVNHFGGEQLGKIIISDLDIRIKQALKWNSSSPLYFLEKDDQYYMTVSSDDYREKIENGYKNVQGSPFSAQTDVGFTFADFTYPGDLIGDAGDTVTDILEKIKSTLGNFEYFYDINGNFVFQQIKNYLNNAQSKYILDALNNRQLVPDYASFLGESYLTDFNSGKSVFEIQEENLVSCSNRPAFNRVKNDFVVWGLRKTSTDYELPIRYHLAIDNKPTVGNTYKVFKYVDLNDLSSERWYAPLEFNSVNDFPQKGTYGVFYLDNDTQLIYTWTMQNDLLQYVQIDATLESVTTKDWRTQLYFQGVAAEPYGLGSNFYYTQLLNEWPKIYNIQPDYIENGEVHNDSDFKEETIRNSSQIDYFLDFIEPIGSDLEKFSINNIGRRTQVFNEEKSVNCVFEPWIPDVVLIKIDDSEESEMSKLRQECQDRGQDYYQVPQEIYNGFIIGGNFNSCYEEIKQTLQQYVNYNEQISLQVLPMYFLEPNTYIKVTNHENNIYGNYFIESLSFSLDTSSYLTINANKAYEKI